MVDARRQQAHDGPRQHRLARAGLADDAERLALVERERDALDGPERAAAGGEGDVEVLDLEQAGARSQLDLVTSKYARSLSATTLRLMRSEEHGGGREDDQPRVGLPLGAGQQASIPR